MTLLTPEQELLQIQRWKAQLQPREPDPFDDLGDAETLMPYAKKAIERGFHVFGLQPKSKITLAGSHGFKDSKNKSDNKVLEPWQQDPSRNIGIATGESDLCVLDFDSQQDIPDWLKEIKTYKVKTSRGVHIYFRGARPGTKLRVGDKVVGDIKSIGGYVLGEGSIHPTGAVYEAIDGSEIAACPDRISELTKTAGHTVDASVDGPPIPYGSHDTELTRIAGVLRNAGFIPEEIDEHLVRVCERRCVGYGDDYKEMCHKIAVSIGKKPVGQASPVLLLDGVPIGSGSIGSSSVNPAEWRNQFRRIGEMEQGDILMLIDGFLPEGTTFLGALPAHGKTWVALSIVRSLTTGKPLFGNPEFGVKQKRSVLYLIPEMGDRTFRTRCERLQIPDDETFLCRTISSGASLTLDNSMLLEAVRQLKPVVFLDTAIRFSKSADENSATANKQLVDDVITLRAAGAIGVVLLHHAKKDSGSTGTMALETMLRGTGDFAAMCDTAYGIRRDDALYNNGGGPLEIDIANIKPRDLVNPPPPFRLAATYKKDGAALPVSHIDETGDFAIVNSEETAKRVVTNLLRVVA